MRVRCDTRGCAELSPGVGGGLLRSRLTLAEESYASLLTVGHARPTVSLTGATKPGERTETMATTTCTTCGATHDSGITETVTACPDCNGIHVEAGIATATDTGVEGGVDVCFTLTLDGVEHDGEVTLLPHADGRPGYGIWGVLDHWLDGRTVALLRDRDREDDGDILDAIEAACAPEAASPVA